MIEIVSILDTNSLLYRIINTNSYIYTLAGYLNIYDQQEANGERQHTNTRLSVMITMMYHYHHVLLSRIGLIQQARHALFLSP